MRNFVMRESSLTLILSSINYNYAFLINNIKIRSRKGNIGNAPENLPKASILLDRNKKQYTDFDF